MIKIWMINEKWGKGMINETIQMKNEWMINEKEWQMMKGNDKWGKWLRNEKIRKLMKGKQREMRNDELWKGTDKA